MSFYEDPPSHSDYCDGKVDPDTDECAACAKREAEDEAYWRALYNGEKRAGLLEPREERHSPLEALLERADLERKRRREEP